MIMPKRGGQFAAVLGIITAMLLPVTSEAQTITSVHVGVSTFAPASASGTPVFTNGGNRIVVKGDLGLLGVTGFQLHPRPCNPVSPGPIVAMGSILERTTEPGTIPGGRLLLSLPLTPVSPIGLFCGHLIGPPGKLNTTSFTVQVYLRGNVTNIAVGGPVQSGMPVTITYTGNAFGLGRTTSSNLMQNKFVLGPVIQNTAHIFQAQATFLRCGPMTLLPSDIFDNYAPDGVLSEFPNTRYRGGAGVSLTVTVVPGPTGCPTTLAPSKLGTIDTDPTCGAPGQPPCCGGPGQPACTSVTR